jgi:hypothetical protein
MGRGGWTKWIFHFTDNKEIAMKIRHLSCLQSAVAVVLACGSAAASAVPLVTYQFPGNPGSLVPTSVDANVTASNVSFTGSASPLVLLGVLAVQPEPGNNTDSDAVANNASFQFTLAPEPGYELDLSAVSFKAAHRPSIRSVNIGFVLRSSIDNFAANIASQDVSDIYPFSFGTFSFTPLSPAYQNLVAPVTFKIYTYQSRSGVLPAMAYDNLTVSGSANAIPEIDAASGVGALALVGFGMALARSRRGIG